jgi:ABC-2 type transport system permease protein
VTATDAAGRRPGGSGAGGRRPGGSGALAAEWIKLSTTQSPLWTAVAVAALSLGLAAVQGATAYELDPMPPEKAALGLAVFGVPVLMVLASMTVTGEYRSGMIRTTFMATPNRTLVLGAKAVVAALFSGLYAAAMVVASIAVARFTATPLVGSTLSLADSATWRPVGAIGLYAALAAVLAVGVGALLRFAAGAVAVILLWPLVVEPLIGSLPGIGSDVGPFLPFANAFVFSRVSWLYQGYHMPWGAPGALAYFSAVVAVAFVAAIVMINRRDA